MNWLTPTKVRELSVTGEGGMLVVNYHSQDLYFYENPRARVEWDARGGRPRARRGGHDPLRLRAAQALGDGGGPFLAAMRAGSRPPVGRADGLAALSIARAIQRSGESHEVVVPSYRELAPEQSEQRAHATPRR